MLTLLTPTRNRAHCFKLLEGYVARMLEHVKEPVEWIVVCDGGIEDYQFTMNQKVISRDPSCDTLHSIQHNYLTALEHVKPESRIACIEDDDWYSACYLSRVSDALDCCMLVGFAPAKYYHVSEQRYLQWDNNEHASLAATAFNSGVVDYFKMSLRVSKFADMVLWCHWGATMRRSCFLLPNCTYQVGLKGLWGERGVGLGHDEGMGSPDPHGRILRWWIGDDAANYLSCASEPETLPSSPPFPAFSLSEDGLKANQGTD